MSVEGDEYGGFDGAIREMRDLLVRLMPESSPTPPAGEDGSYVAYAVPWDVVRAARRAVERYDALEARLKELMKELAGQKQNDGRDA